MSDKDVLKDIFSEKLKELEIEVRPEVWSSISSSIPSASSALGSALVSKWIIGTLLFSSLGIGGYILLSKDDQKVNAEVITHEKTIEKKEKKEVLSIDEKLIVPIKPSTLLSTSSKESKVVISNVPQPEVVIPNHKEPKVPVVPIAELPIQLELQNNQPKEVPQETVVVTESPEIIEPIGQKVKEIVSNSSAGKEIKLPNVFTPNNDGMHDYLLIESEGLNDFSLVVMNSQNVIVFKTNDPSFNWNGVGLNGEPVMAGQYIYYFTAFDAKGMPVNRYSTLTIIR